MKKYRKLLCAVFLALIIGFDCSIVMAQEMEAISSEVDLEDVILEDEEYSEPDYISSEVNLDSTSDEDYDGDTIPDELDNCPDIYNKDQKDTDLDKIGDVCDDTPDKDIDEDGVPDNIDNCIRTYNPDQEDENGDSQGDACTDLPNDFDNDGIADIMDNCPYMANPQQEDKNGNGQGDKCENRSSYYLDNIEDEVGDAVIRFTLEPEFTVEDGVIYISFETNVPTSGAIVYGEKRNNLNQYISDSENKTSHLFKIENFDGNKLFFNVVVSSDDEEIESKLQEIIVNEDALEDEISDIDMSAILSEQDIYKEKLYLKMKKESDLLEENLKESFFVIFSSILAMATILKWDEIHDFYGYLTKKRD